VAEIAGKYQRIDLQPIAYGKLLEGPPETKGIIGHKLAPFRNGFGLRGRKEIADWNTFRMNAAAAKRRPLGGKGQKIPVLATDTPWVVEPYATDVDYDEFDLKGMSDITKFEASKLAAANWQWFLAHEFRVLTELDANVTGVAATAAWNAAAGTAVIDDVLGARLAVNNATNGMMTPNCFAAPLRTFDALQNAPEFTGLLTGLTDLKNLGGDMGGQDYGGQFKAWLMSNGFKYVYVGRSPNWQTGTTAYLLYIDDEATSALDSNDTACTITPGNVDDTTDVVEYMENGRKHIISVENCVVTRAFYGTDGGRRITGVHV
jgi:hypothetical protein